MAAPQVKPTKRTVRQIVPVNGGPPKATATSNVWVATPHVFSRPEEGNAIRAFITGEDYFADLIDSLDAASSEVYIAGWQINWDALLAEGVRLYDVVYRNAKRGVKFYVMPWKHADPVQTYDGASAKVLNSINARLRRELKISEKRVFIVPAASLASVNAGYFSHHQKQVVVDRKIGYIGGIDLAYGRFDDASYDLNPAAKGRKALNRYNGCVDQVGTLREQDGIDPDLLDGTYDWASGNAASVEKRIEQGGWQIPYTDNSPITGGSGVTTEKDRPSHQTLSDAQPRMPWQDLHSRIEGPAVAHLLRNFVQRWNVVADKSSGKAPRLPLPGSPKTFDKKGSATIQVLRSAPASMIAAETRSNRGLEPTPGTQDDIHHAMVELIKKASRFIYIENQFFVSDFGALGESTPAGLSPAAQAIQAGKVGDEAMSDTTLWMVRQADDHRQDALKLPTNLVCKALVTRIQTAILDVGKPKFHVYITLPVHPEGKLGKPSVAVQIYYTMQTISHGRRSLLNGVRRALKARELRDAGEKDFMRVIDDDADREHRSITDEQCFEWVTLLNLRNWATNPAGGYITEQIYGHTKLMIVDDLYALFGSANINDRSLLGERDSELAVLVVDNDHGRADLNGAGSQRPVRKFAHELRMRVWEKLFGITGKVRPAAHLQTAIKQPGHPESWKAIQKQANANTALYEKAFWFIPRSRDRLNPTLPASILPSWNATDQNPQAFPCERRFWSVPQYTEAAAQLVNCKGFITALPIHWLENENVLIKFPTGLIVRTEPNDTRPASGSGDVQVASKERAQTSGAAT